MDVVFRFAAQFIEWLVYILVIAIFLRSILSFFWRGEENPIMRILLEVTEPILAPLRRVIPSVGMLDLSPFVAMILLQFVGSIVVSMLRGAAY
ncbi:MAG TPA: YggT family protein [Chloroflexota bacterium]|nr:YggT family protein [Chloroflexota bacterium]